MHHYSFGPHTVSSESYVATFGFENHGVLDMPNFLKPTRSWTQPYMCIRYLGVATRFTQRGVSNSPHRPSRFFYKEPQNVQKWLFWPFWSQKVLFVIIPRLGYSAIHDLPLGRNAQLPQACTQVNWYPPTLQWL